MQTYELSLTRIGKLGKSKSMALKAKSSDTDESLDDEDSKVKSYITKAIQKVHDKCQWERFRQGS